eukprot:30578-Chlamydomonas_euryale.AAC.1
MGGREEEIMTGGGRRGCGICDSPALLRRRSTGMRHLRQPGPPQEAVDGDAASMTAWPSSIAIAWRGDGMCSGQN